MFDLKSAARNPELGAAVRMQALDLDAIATVRVVVLDAFTHLGAGQASEAEGRAFAEFIAGQKFSDDLAGLVQKGRLTGAFLGQRLVGVTGWGEGRDSRASARLHHLFVDPMFVECGIGTVLLTRTEADGQAYGALEISARSLLFGSGFFEKRGYAVSTYGVVALSTEQRLAVAYLRKPLVALPSTI